MDYPEGELAIPTCEFGIVAGGKNDGRGYRSSLPGDNDGTVTTDETKLAGASDFAVVPVRHTFLMTDSQVQGYVLSFLNKGFFVAADKRVPIAEAALERNDKR